MDNDLAGSIDAEMEGFISDGASPGDLQAPVDPNQTPAAPSQTSTPSVLKAGGREWKSPEELAKAYTNLQAMHGKYVNEAKPWLGFRDHLKQNPELRQKYIDVTQEYQKARNSGLSQKQAEQKTGIDPVISEKLERMEAQYEDLKVEKEINAVRSKYKLDNAALRKIIEIADAHDGIPLELAYKAYAHDNGLQAARQQGAAEAKNAADATKVGGTPPGVQASPKGISLANDKAWRESAASALDKFGFN